MKERDHREDLRFLADAMDSHFRGPFGWRFGWDGLLGLVPIVGDIVTNGVSVYIILRAAQLGCSASVLVRMGLNLLVENIVDIIPFAGNLFDFFWKANSKNLQLIEKHISDPRATRNRSLLVVCAALAAVISIVVGSIVPAIYALKWVLTTIGGAA